MKRNYRTLAAWFAMASASTVALGQGEAPESNDAALEEIVVTARKVEERLQEVPLSIRAFSGEALQAAGIMNVTDLAAATPGLAYATDLGRTAERPVVRGISSLRPEAAQPVSVFLDGAYVRDGVLSLMLEDVQRVEVVKGPQSALYGRASYAGAINVVSKRPSEALEARVTATAAEDGHYEAFGVLSGPLVGDRLLGRVSIKHYEFGGQYTNRLTGNEIGDEETNQIEAALTFKASESLEIRLQAGWKEDRDGLLLGVARPVPTVATVGGVPTITSLNGTSNVANGSTCNGRVIAIAANNPATGQPDPAITVPATTLLNGWPCGARNAPGDLLVSRNEADLADYTDPRTGKRYGDIAGLAREQVRATLTVDWSFGDGYQLTAQTGYMDRDQQLGTDQSYNGTRFAVTGTPWTTFDDDKLQTLSQEIRLVSPRDQSLRWLAGAFYYEEDFEGITTGVIRRGPAPTFTVTAAPTRLSSPRTVDNYAAFGQIELDATDQLTLSAELRYNWERTRFGDDTPLGTAIVTTDRFTLGQPVIVNVPVTEKSWAPRLSATYKLSDDLMFYAQVAEGFKGGGINVSAGTPASQVEYVGEEVRSYEAGMKSEWFNNRLRANVALFWNDLDNLQLSQAVISQNPVTALFESITVISNVGKARTRGLELELDAALGNGMRAGISYAFTDAKALRGFEITNGNAFAGNQSVDGAELPRSPKHSGAAYFAASLPLNFGSELSWDSRIDVLYESRRYAEIQNLIWADPRTRVNLSTSIGNERWEVTAWVRNLTNAKESVNGFRYLDPVTFRRTAVDWLPRLRQVGVTATLSF